MARAIPNSDIPADVLDLIKVLADEPALRQKLSEAHGVSEDDVVAAAKLYIQCILTTARADDRRMLCLPPGAEVAAFKEHKKWLLKWLHPDRNHDSWENALFLKVTEAFNRLQSAPLTIVVPAPAQRHTKNGRRSSPHRHLKRQSTNYEKTGFAKLFQQTTKPILIVVGLTLLGCLIYFSMLSHE